MRTLRLGRGRRLRHVATIARIPAGTDDTARETVISRLRCSAVYEMDGQEQERAGMASVKRPMRVYTEVPATAEIENRMRFLLGESDYRIHHIGRWPENEPVYLELFLEGEGARP